MVGKQPQRLDWGRFSGKVKNLSSLLEKARLVMWDCPDTKYSPKFSEVEVGRIIQILNGLQEAGLLDENSDTSRIGIIFGCIGIIIIYPPI